MRRPYANYDKEIHDQIQVIWKESPDLRVLTDFVKGMLVEILASSKHVEKVGEIGMATSCGFLDKQLYVAVNFSDPLSGDSLESLSQIFFLPEVRFLRRRLSEETKE
jgi:hypothetical protein